MLYVNLNDSVKVKLTDFGRDVLIFRYQKQLGLDDYEIKEDSDGYYHTQVWNLMNIFGKYLYGGSTKMPFEMNIIVY